MSNVPNSQLQGDAFIELVRNADKLKAHENYKEAWEKGNWTKGVTMSKTTEVFKTIIKKQ